MDRGPEDRLSTSPRPSPGAPVPGLPSPLEWPRLCLIGLVHLYRWLLKPWLGNACRFEPTCSAYALDALRRHGAVRGVALSGWRLARCHPWCEGGHDPVPERLRPLRPPAEAFAGLFTRLTGVTRPPLRTPDPPPTRDLP